MRTGRKGKYREWLTEDGLTLLRGVARDGYTDDQIAKYIGISRATFYEWKNRFPDFADAVKEGKDVWDRKAEEALGMSATGYYRDEDVIIKEKDGGETIKRVRKWYPPNATSLIFLLKNRKPGDWRDRKNQKITIERSIQDEESKIHGLLEDIEDGGESSE